MSKLKLSLVFQEHQIELSHVHPLITSCIRTIEGMKDVPGPTGENANTHIHDDVGQTGSWPEVNTFVTGDERV